MSAAVQVGLALGICIANVFGYVSLLSAASGLVDETERGWVLGLSSAAVAVCVFISGLMTQLLVVLPPAPFLALGGRWCCSPSCPRAPSRRLKPPRREGQASRGALAQALSRF